MQGPEQLEKQKRDRSPEPYRQRKPAQQYPDVPWNATSSQAPHIGQGSKGSKAPRRPKSPPPAKELVTVKEDTFTPVARPSKTKLELRRQLPKHLVEGKGQAAASSSVTVPVRHQTAAKARYQNGGYADPVIQAVLIDICARAQNFKYQGKLACRPTRPNCRLGAQAQYPI